MSITSLLELLRVSTANTSVLDDVRVGVNRASNASFD